MALPGTNAEPHTDLHRFDGSLRAFHTHFLILGGRLQPGLRFDGYEEEQESLKAEVETLEEWVENEEEMDGNMDSFL